MEEITFGSKGGKYVVIATEYRDNDGKKVYEVKEYTNMREVGYQNCCYDLDAVIELYALDNIRLFEVSREVV